ncbi:toxin-antitoxin system, antitoxin component [Candidatus Desantisbacteria bacterium]|nr:toxin-antitoxin system, antitoxin component [Candidatus Desantisbacteria bacterium]
MPQISLYIGHDVLEKIEKMASMEHLSISKWVSKKVKNALDNNWPSNYFNLYGSIYDNKFIEPKELKLKDDIKREKI